MITIHVAAYNGNPVSQSISANFGETGGTIGRSPDNALVLLDPERKISRVHASVSYAGGAFVLRDQGSMAPVVLNGQPLGHGREAAIAPGDEIRIAGYVLRVRPHGAAADAARDAGDRTPASAGPRGEPASAPGAMPQAGSAAYAANESEREPASPSPATTQTTSQPPSPVQMATEALPLAHAAVRMATEAAPAPPAPVQVTAEAASEPPLSPAAATKTMAPPAAPAAPAQAAEAAPQEAKPEMTEPVLSWLAAAEAPGSVDITTIILAPSGHGAASPGTAHAHSPVSTKTASAEGPTAIPASPATSAANSSPSTTPVEAASSNEALLRALLSGAGVRSVDIPGGLTPDMMRQLGQVLREATGGLLDLLAARASTKREVRADMTVIVASDNNPLKFSPDLEAALTHLLAPRGRGFMPPLRAVTDAYDDLRAHQLGFMAGMRSALAVVLARFDPRVLEERLTGTSMVDSILPTHRKAKLWDLFGELYSTISKDAQSDFHNLFGEEFLRAYKAHVAKIPERGDRAAPH